MTWPKPRVRRHWIPMVRMRFSPHVPFSPTHTHTHAHGYRTFSLNSERCRRHVGTDARTRGRWRRSTTLTALTDPANASHGPHRARASASLYNANAFGEPGTVRNGVLGWPAAVLGRNRSFFEIKYSDVIYKFFPRPHLQFHSTVYAVSPPSPLKHDGKRSRFAYQ